MEQASVQLAQPLPLLEMRGHTLHPSVSNVRLPISYMHLWPNFLPEVQTAISGVAMTGLISTTNSTEGEMFYVGNELGLTGRFVQNVGAAVTKAFRHGCNDILLNSLHFADYHSGGHVGSIFPGVVIVKDNGNASCELRAVGEIKTYWTLPLHRIPVTTTDEDEKARLEIPMGQLATNMARKGLRYGFLSTYHATVFVRRADNFRFELSTPVLWDSRNPSLRECFVALGTLLTDDNFQFAEEPGVKRYLLRTGGIPAFRASDRHSPYRSFGNLGTGNNVDSAEGSSMGHSRGALQDSIELHNITPYTVFIEAEGTTVAVAQLGDVIQGDPPHRTVFNSEFRGEAVILKYWPVEQERRYSNEVTAYGILPTDSPFFPKLLMTGSVNCGAVLQEGYVAILTKMPGERFTDAIWTWLGSEGRQQMEQRLRNAVQVLRDHQMFQGDPRKDNVLYDLETGGVVLLDFESLVDNRDYGFGIEGPEIKVIMEEPIDFFPRPR